MTIKSSSLRKAIPLIKEYAKQRGKHTDQLFYTDHVWLGNAPTAYIEDGVLFRTPQNQQYCTGMFFSHHIPNKKPIILVQLQPCRPDLDVNAFNAYIDWLVNSSPWADAFISKNFKRIMRDNVLVIDGTISRAYVKQATIAARMPWENYHFNKKYLEVGVWYELSQKIHPNLAYVVAKLVTTVKKTDVTKITRKSIEHGHAPINHDPNRRNMQVTGWMIGKRAQGGSSVWSYRKGMKDVTTRVEEIIESIDADEKKNNPFLPSVTKEWDRKKFVEAMYDKLPAIESFSNTPA